MVTDKHLFLVSDDDPITATSSQSGMAVNFIDGIPLLPTGTAMRGMELLIHYSNALVTSSPGTDRVFWTVECSPTQGGTFSEMVSSEDHAVTLTTDAQAGELFLPFVVDALQPWVRSKINFSDNSHGDTCAYYADIVL